MTSDEIEAIVLAEYKYWRAAPESIDMIAMGAMGAAANILGAISFGHRAPWHPRAGAKEEPAA